MFQYFSTYDGVCFGTLLILIGIFIIHKDLYTTLSVYNNQIEGYYFGYQQLVPFSYLDFCGSLLTCMAYRQSLQQNATYRFSMECLLSTLLMQFGGTTLTAVILLGQIPSYILSHTAMNAFLLAWWLCFACPYDVFYRLFDDNRYIRPPSSLLRHSHSLPSPTPLLCFFF